MLSRWLIQVHQVSGNPLAAKVFSRKFQFRESNAFVKSSFRKIAGDLDWEIFCRISRVAKKFSAICLPRMKAVCLKETRLGRCRDKRVAMIFEIIFGIRLIMLIGRNSPTAFAPSFLGIMRMFARFSSFNDKEPDWNPSIIAIVSTLISDQYNCANSFGRPSGPDALFLAKLKTAFSISCKEKKVCKLVSGFGFGIGFGYRLIGL